jgi:phage terminase large subunit GpA-like protein
MLDDALDDHSIETVWLMGRQLGKTLSLILIAEYFIEQNPSSQLVVYPKIDDARTFLRDKFTPTYKATPCMAGLIKEPRKHDSENTLLNKGYPGGELSGAGANSPSTLRQRSKRVILLDEIDAYQDNEEGDPVEQADGRAETFTNAVKLKCSTPTMKDSSRIEALYEQSDKQMWFVPCPKCGEYQTLKWSQVKFSFKNDNGKEYRDIENTVYACEHCNHWLSDRERIAAINAGEWRPTAPFTGIRGRHLSGLYRTIGKKKAYKSYLHEFADQFLKAKSKGESSLMVWTNTFLAETWAGKRKTQSMEPLLERVEEYKAEVPAGVLVLVGAVDVQATRLEYHVAGFGLNEESWAIDRVTIPGDPLLQLPWKKLDEVRRKRYQRENGHTMPIAILFIDSGGQIRGKPFSKAVYNYVLRWQGRAGRGAGGVYACKGSSTATAPIWREKPQPNGVLLQEVGTGEAKGLFYEKLDVIEPGAGYVHFPKDERFDFEYFQQITAEERIPEQVRGYTVERWVKRRDRNEGLDLWAYSHAALDKLNPNWKALAQRYAKRSEQAAAPEPEQDKGTGTLNRVPQPPKPRRRPRHSPFRRRI